MNEVLSQLHARKSVRAFLDRPISPEARRAILEAACAAPTAGNQQLYTILDITDQAVKDTLADTCDHQPFIAQAPLVLLFCADCQKWYDAFAAGGCSPRRPGPGDLWLALSDANIAAQNAVTEMTNQLLRKNADTLKMGTIATAKEAERSIVDIETLQHTNQQLISTLDEVMNIQKEGAEKRKAAEVELGRIEGELKQKLLELRG